MSIGLVALAVAPMKVGLDQVAQRLEQGESLRAVVYGTSLSAHGAWVPQVARSIDRKFPGQIEWINSSGSGKNSDWGLKHLNDRVLVHRPDLVFLEFSINDAVARLRCPVPRAEANLREMISRLRDANPRVQIVLQTTNPVFRRPLGHSGYRPRLEDYSQSVRRVAHEMRTMLADQEREWHEVLEGEPGRLTTLVPDGLHPNSLGSETVTVPVILETLGYS